jgi:hypothetical protein
VEEQLPAIRAAVQDVQAATLDASSHYLHLDRPGRLLELLVDGV